MFRGTNIRITADFSSDSSHKMLFFDHSEFKLYTNNMKISGKLPSIWKLNNTFISNSWFEEEIKKEI